MFRNPEAMAPIATGAQPGKSLREGLIGAWRLVSCVETDVETGEIFLPMGEHHEGLILYTPDGYMSAQLSAPDRRYFESGDMLPGLARGICQRRHQLPRLFRALLPRRGPRRRRARDVRQPVPQLEGPAAAPHRQA
jgi:hypothetical protein